MNCVDYEIRELPDRGQIAVLYLNNPDTKNSMTLEMGMQFNRALSDLASHDPQIRALVITGKNGVFSSGGDFGLLSSFAGKDPEENNSFMESFYRLFLEVRNMPFPVIAAVNGHAIGASLALALACDLRYFTIDAKYAFNFVRIGIHPGMGSSFLVKEVAGLHHAQELLLTGRYIDGAEAQARGLCHAALPGDQVLQQALETASEIAGAAPQAVRMLKHGLYANRTMEQAIVYEAASQAQNYTTRDFRAALAAIQKKESPVFEDC
ncbi:MAG: enoyl-CoA hydratase/isomerase family protein [Leptospiraceae bacterium]|nr:enoyl-CoA hydratase/isomerase family protein [Leptospiraceae bacterium]